MPTKPDRLPDGEAPSQLRSTSVRVRRCVVVMAPIVLTACQQDLGFGNTSRPSLTTASLANKPTSRSCTPLSVTVNELPPCASTIAACKRCSPPWPFSRHLNGFCQGNCESTWLNLLGLDPATYPPGRMTYDLRRLRLHALIRRIPGTQRYHVTAQGYASRCSLPAPMPGYFAPSSPIFLTPLPEPPPRSVGLSTGSIEIKRYCFELNLAA